MQIQFRKALGQSPGKKGIDTRLILDIPFLDVSEDLRRFRMGRQEFKDSNGERVSTIMEKCSAIAQKISEDPFMSIQRIAQCTGLRRSTVSRYMKNRGISVVMKNRGISVV